jgi:hypothetical protein
VAFLLGQGKCWEEESLRVEKDKVWEWYCFLFEWYEVFSRKVQYLFGGDFDKGKMRRKVSKRMRR